MFQWFAQWQHQRPGVLRHPLLLLLPQSHITKLLLLPSSARELGVMK